MKNLRLLGFLMMLASSSLFINCTSDPIQGPPGEAGVDGIDGVDSTTDCRACHSKEYRDEIKAEYALSVHAQETLHDRSDVVLTTSEYANRTDCVMCHTGPGYIDKMNNIPTAEGDPAYPVGTLLGENSAHVLAINCKTCHDEHRYFNFDEEENDFALRTLAPVQLIIDNSITIDSKNVADLLGYSNTCVNCHQPRDSAPTDDDATEGMFTIPQRFGPHHGPQSTMLEGLGGAEIAGALDYPAVGAAGHKERSSCVTCHMDERTADGTKGGHTWVPSRNVCTDCHESGDPGDVADYEASRLELLGLLKANGVFNEKDELIEKVEVTILNAKAAWNYIYLLEDSSDGIHNPDYAKALLANTIEALQNQNE